MNIRLNSDSLVPNMRINLSILHNNVLGMNYKPLGSRIYSFIKLIWGIFISVQMRTKVVREWTYSAEQAFENPRR
jgi:hypothetical protein